MIQADYTWYAECRFEILGGIGEVMTSNDKKGCAMHILFYRYTSWRLFLVEIYNFSIRAEI